MDNFVRESHPFCVDVTQPSLFMRIVWTVWMLMIAIGILGVMAWTIEANSAEVFKSDMRDGGKMSLTLKETQCSDADVLKHLLERVRPEFLSQFKDATLNWGGKDWASCWIDVQGVVYSMDAEGAPLQPLPREMFRESTI